MFLGHYAVALGAKRLAPRASLGTLVLAAQLLDGVWPVFLLTGIERVRIVPGLMEASPLDFVHYPYSHSLAAAVGWGALTAVLFFAARRYAAGALVVGAVVVSHWLLDAPMHRPDLPLWPGGELRVGGGLWNSVPLSLALELGLLAAGVAVYLQTTAARDRVGRWGLAAMVGLLLVSYVGALFGPPPASEAALAVAALTLWLFVPWAYWVDRHRTLRRGADAPPRGRSARSAAAAAAGEPAHRA